MSEANSPSPAAWSAPIEALLGELGGATESLWTRLAPGSGRTRTRVLFTAAEPGAGTTLLAGVVAWELSQNLRQRTVLVEANVRRPALATYLGLGPVVGLSDVLDRRAELDGCRLSLPQAQGLEILAAGTTRAPVPGELVTPLAREILVELAREADVLVVDAPALSEGPETRLLFDQVDGVVLVLRARRTAKADAKRAAAQVEAAGLPILGAILNRYRPEWNWPRR